jgi:CRP-like cAMP-binding protein
MKETDILGFALRQFGNLSEEGFKMSLPYWHLKEYKKGEYYNEYRNVCRYLGFVVHGFFRAYLLDTKKQSEKNVFFFPTHQFVVTYKSFINQVPCDYYTQAMTDSKVLCITLQDLHTLYNKSHEWERIGRLAAERAFNVAIDRAEGMLFKSPEERYLDLVKHQPDIFNQLPLYQISSYLGIQGPSLSRIRKRLSGKK